jgi:hypothetical protein
MAVQERSLGPLYAALVPVTVPRVPYTLVGIVEEHKPFRRGKALMIPRAPYTALVLGVWVRWWAGRHAELGDDRWLAGRWLSYTPHDISDWNRGPDDGPGSESEEGPPEEASGGG